MPRKNWYLIQAKQNGDEKVTEIRIYDEIGFWGETAKSFTDKLDAVSVDTSRIVVSLNSPGGSVFDAFAIYNALVRHKLPVTTRVDGVAASAASLIFMAGDERVMPENAMIMIHNAAGWAAGTAQELRNAAEMLDKARNGIVAAYARSGQADEEIISMMDATTWMDALEAQSLGFATAMEDPIKLVAHADAIELLAKHDGVPEAFLTALEPEDAAPAADSPPEGQDDAPAGSPTNVNPPSASDLVARVYAECRSRQMPQLAEGVLISCSFTDQATVDARLDEAEQIAGICLAAKLKDRAPDFITAGLNVEQVRARLFEHVVQASENVQISNLQRPAATMPAASAGPNPSAIYAARKAK